MSYRERTRLEEQGRAVRHLARGLALIPLTPVLLAFALPIATLELHDDDPVPLTFSGLIGEFDNMRHAPGVQPLVWLLIAALVTLFVGCCVIAAGTTVEHRWAVAIDVAAIVVIVGVLLLAPFLGVADHVQDGDDTSGPYSVHAQGWAVALLASGLAIAAVRIKRQVDDSMSSPPT